MDDKNAMVSVIVICRNARPFIETCLASIQSQKSPIHEILVVDGQSTDGTFQWVQQQPSVRVLPQPDLGIANARNLGLSQATGRLIAFLDADDVWVVNKLSLQLPVLADNPQVEAVTGQLIKSNERQQRYRAMTPGGFLFRRTVFERYGLFNPRWHIASEHEWFLRAQRLGMVVAEVPEVVIHKSMHGRNVSVTQKKLYRDEMMLILKEHHQQRNTLHRD